jgi:hypothetical protein
MKTDAKIFTYLDRAFWMAWGALPFLAGFRIYFLFTSAYFNADGSAGGEMPIMEFSLAGKILASSFLCVNVILYVALLAYMHTLTRQFQRGILFVDGTLKYMQRIALLMMAWPLIKVISYNLTSYTLVQLGDVHGWKLKFDLDLPLISAGLIILALRLVMSHAIKLHHDVQYTV